MNLYHIKGQSLSIIQHEEFKLEKDLQKIVETNLETLFGFTFVSSEFSIGEFRLDTLAYDEENKALVIIEYKKRHRASVIDQGFPIFHRCWTTKQILFLNLTKEAHKT